MLDDAADDARESDKDDLWSDVSEEEIYKTTVGKAEGCINNGVVEGDINAGGVAGAMAVESMLDPEEDIERVGDDSFSFHYETRAILLNCENRVPVTSKKDYAGGIVGRMDLGYILDCRNYGNVESTDGSYVGGIAGSSASTIRRSQSKCMASGKNFVGGIAGDGYNLTENLAFVSIGNGEMYCGAIAGRVDDEGEISSNRFVENGSAGIDGVSYAGKAEPISYESLMAEENAPEEFGKFTLTYIADDTLAGRVSCKYGEPLSGLAVPSVPQKPGYHGEWEPVGEDTITFDHVLKAVYTPHVTTVESSARRDDVRAVILAEGTFHEDTELSAEKLSEERDRETWRITLTGDLGGEEESPEAYTYRFILPKDWENASLTIKTAQGSEEAGCKKDQSALVFSTAWTDFELTAEKTGAGAKGGWMIPALAGGALLAAAVLVFLFVKKKKRALPEENGDHQKAVQEAEKPARRHPFRKRFPHPRHRQRGGHSHHPILLQGGSGKTILRAHRAGYPDFPRHPAGGKWYRRPKGPAARVRPQRPALQLDTVDAQTLREAQRDPETYKTLSVRVSGWNARFITLEKEWQSVDHRAHGAGPLRGCRPCKTAFP